jgi:hypothetical protein
MPAKAYQWKEAFEIPLVHKWNLISLPLVPLVDPQQTADVLAAYANKSDIMSVWNYEYTGTVGAWVLDPLTIKDGKSYFIRIKYDALNPAGSSAGTMWVWGTPKPVPPNSPSAYPVRDGWNMVGFTEVAPLSPMASTGVGGYLWNLTVGAVYRWDGPTQSYVLAPNMASGNGYWASLATAGTVYPP